MKKLLSSLFVLFFALTLVACDMGGTGGTGTGGEPTDDKIQVTFWHAMGQANQKIIQEMIDSFEKLYPEVHVEQVSQGGYDDLLDKVKNNIKAGTTPTLAQTYPDHVTSYLTAKDAVIDLNDYVYDEEIGFDALGVDPSVYVDTFWNESFSYDKAGSMYSLPFTK